MSYSAHIGRAIKDILVAAAPTFLVMFASIVVVYKFVNPAPPTHIVIASGDPEGAYHRYAKMYAETLKQEGIRLEIQSSTGAVENYQRLRDDESPVEVALVQDGIGSPKDAPELLSLGSLYYEPVWVFYRPTLGEISRLSQLEGKTLAIGKPGGGTLALARQLLKASGVDEQNSHYMKIGWTEAAEALRQGRVDATFLIGSPKDALIAGLLKDESIKLMSFDQAQGTTITFPFLHHLVIPHGAVDLKRNIPSRDVHLVAPTATLLAREELHPALTYLILKAAAQVHNEPGIFEKRGEFPVHKSYQFPLSKDAKVFYRSGAPFLQRNLPFWLATLIDRFIIFVIPVIVVLLPMIRMIPHIYRWRIRRRIYQRYGELKFLETQLKPMASAEELREFIEKLDDIEERVNQLRVPLEYSDHVYELRQHIDYVRERLRKVSHEKRGQSTTPGPQALA